MKTQVLWSEASEKAVIGACLLDPDLARWLTRVLEPRDFYDARNQEVFRVLQAKAQAEMIVDIEMFVEKVPGATHAELTEYIDAIPSTATAEYHARNVQEHSIRRKLIYVARDLALQAQSMETDLDRIVVEALDRIRACTLTEKVAITDPTVHQEAYEEMVRSWGDLRMLGTGIREVDDDIGGGIFPGEIMVFVGGEGSMKTSLALHAIEYYIQTVGRKVLFLSLDMPAYQVNIRRLMPIMQCSEKEVAQHVLENSEAYRQAKAERARLDRGLFRIVHGEYTINDIDKLLQAEKPAVVVLDYMTAVAGFKDELETARQVTAALRRWKREHQCAFLVLNQMSEIALANQRKGDVGTGRGLGGGSLRRAADVVLELFRDKPDPIEDLSQWNDAKPKIICSVAKTRRGAAGKHWNLEYIGYTMQFTGRATQAVFRNKRHAEPVYEIPEFPL